MSNPPSQREFALEVVRRLRDAGREALWAGGCVRDELLGKRPKDYDVATSAPPDEVRELFGRRRTVAVGAAFGVVSVLGPRGVAPVEVATFRSDGDYTDGRRPDTVRFTTAEEDARRRDFTVNGLFYDPVEERVLDFVGGQADLASRVLRAIGDPAARFAEDRLRMLRAVRFASSLGFDIDADTSDAVRRHAAGLVSVSAERVGAEVRRMLTEWDAARAVRLLRAHELTPYVLPPLAAAGEVATEAAAARLGRLATGTAAAALACCLEEVASPDEVAGAARALRWTSKEADLASWLAEKRLALDDAPTAAWSRVQPLLAAEGGRDLVALRRARRGEDAAQKFSEERLGWVRERLDPPPLLVGADLLAAGVRPGPGFGELLARARAAQLDGLADNREGALRLLGLAP